MGWSYSPRISHLSNETGERNLADKGIADIQKGAHRVDKCGSLDGNSGDNWRSQGRAEARRLFLDGLKDGCQQHRDEGEEGRRRAKLGHHAKRARQRGDQADDGDDDAEDHGAAPANVIGRRHGVEVLCANQNMQGLDKRVVEDKHDGGSPPRPFLAPEEHLANVAHVAHLWMSQAKLPQDETCVEHNGGNEDGQDEARDKAQHAVRPGETHNGQTNVLAEEQRGRLLPRAGPVLDRVAIF